MELLSTAWALVGGALALPSRWLAAFDDLGAEVWEPFLTDTAG